MEGEQPIIDTKDDGRLSSENKNDNTTEKKETAKSDAKKSAASKQEEPVKAASRDDGKNGTKKETAPKRVDPVKAPARKLHYKDLEKWQKTRIIRVLAILFLAGGLYLIATCSTLLSDKETTQNAWDHYINPDSATEAKYLAQEKQAGSTAVTVGTYIENLKEISIKNCSFEVVGLIWFKWNGDDALDPANNFRFYKGTMKSMEVIKEENTGGTHYQLVRFDVSVTRNFWNRRFPLETHQLNLYAESNYPITRMYFVGDKDSSIYDNLSVAGYEIINYGTTVRTQQYTSTNGDPQLTQPIATSEYLTAMMINRSSWGTYLKCFIALVGTITWVMITLFICTYHRVDPLSMIPAALFGTVTNLMVGASLLPDAMEIGLLEFVNFYGIATILAGAIGVININRLRNHYEARAFAGYYGSVYFFTLLFFVLAGNILMPVCAYVF